MLFILIKQLKEREKGQWEEVKEDAQGETSDTVLA